MSSIDDGGRRDEEVEDREERREKNLTIFGFYLYKGIIGRSLVFVLILIIDLHNVVS